MLRPGKAGANAVADHLEVLDAALAQLPAAVAGGHRVGDDLPGATRQVIARTDSAGCTTGFVTGCWARNVKFMVVARRNSQVQGAIFDAVGMDDLWEPARTQDGEVRPDAGLIELTSEVDLSK